VRDELTPPFPAARQLPLILIVHSLSQILANFKNEHQKQGNFCGKCTPYISCGWKPIFLDAQITVCPLHCCSLADRRRIQHLRRASYGHIVLSVCVLGVCSTRGVVPVHTRAAHGIPARTLLSSDAWAVRIVRIEQVSTHRYLVESHPHINPWCCKGYTATEEYLWLWGLLDNDKNMQGWSMQVRTLLCVRVRGETHAVSTVVPCVDQLLTTRMRMADAGHGEEPLDVLQLPQLLHAVALEGSPVQHGGFHYAGAQCHRRERAPPGLGWEMENSGAPADAAHLYAWPFPRKERCLDVSCPHTQPITPPPV
jgi:hypothetical protein